MHTDYISAQTAERRKQKVDDVQKRSEYRKAHGLDKEGIFGGWTARTDDEVMGPGYREGGGRPSLLGAAPVGVAAPAELEASPVANEESGAEGKGGVRGT